MSSTITGSDSYPAGIQIPSDGDPRNASSINTPIEALANRTTHSHNRIGSYRLFDLRHKDSNGTSIECYSTSDTYGAEGNLELVLINDCLALDRVEVRMSFHGKTTASSAGWRLAYSLDGGTPQPMSGARVEYAGVHTGSKLPYMISGYVNLGAGGTLRVFLQQITGQPGPSNQVELVQPYSSTIEVWRPNT